MDSGRYATATESTSKEEAILVLVADTGVCEQTFFASLRQFERVDELAR